MPKHLRGKRSRDSRTRGFCATYFSEEKPTLHKFMRYLCAQQERAPTTGKLHWQAYIHTDADMTVSAVIKQLPGVHIERRLGSIQQAIDYCRKPESAVPDSFFEVGEKPTQGARTDLYTAAAEVRKGGLSAVTDDTMIVKYGVGLSRLDSIRFDYRGFKPKTVVWYHGPAGSGKSKTAQDEAPGTLYRKPTSQWFDGYAGQDSVIIEDYDSSYPMTLTELLQLLDGYPMMVPLKGSYAPMRARHIAITSIQYPRFYFDIGRWPEVWRRITRIVELASIT